MVVGTNKIYLPVSLSSCKVAVLVTLRGSALTASGLATLGGGALAVGGGGMMLGSAILYTASSTIGAIVLGSTVSADYCELPDYVYYDIIYDDKGKIIYEGEFYGILPHGKGAIKIDGEYIKTRDGIPLGC